MAVEILIGDVFDKLRELPADHFDCVVTSPPYWGLRDYGVDGQIGLEATVGEHLTVMVAVFEEVRRVLKPTGTCWVNYGDCYATSPNGRSAADTKAAGNDDRTFRDKPFSTIGGVLKPKDLCMIPNRLAIALQEAGWWVRSEIIWAKPNPMPESIKDRPGAAHEKIFMLSKAPRYFYNAAAVRQKASEARWAQDVEAQEGSHRANGGRKTNGTMKSVGGRRTKQDDIAAAAAAAGGSSGQRMAGFNGRWAAAQAIEPANGRGLRNYEPAPVQVWNIPAASFSDAHFATFPLELAGRCLQAGCPPKGLALDPFGGAGTVGLMADQLGMDAVLIELNPEYADLARRRLRAGLVAVTMDAIETHDVGPLFAEAGKNDGVLL